VIKAALLLPPETLLPLTAPTIDIRWIKTFHLQKPRLYQSVSPGTITTGNTLKGRITCGLTNHSATYILTLIAGTVTSLNHESETHSLYSETRTLGSPKAFTLVTEENGHTKKIENLTATAFHLEVNKDNPLKLTLEVEGPENQTETILPQIPEPTDKRFYFLTTPTPETLTLTRTLAAPQKTTIYATQEIKTNTLTATTSEEWEPRHTGRIQIHLPQIAFKNYHRGNKMFEYEVFGEITIELLFYLLYQSFQ